MRILVADDEPISRRLLQFQLEQWGHTVCAVSNGAQAWAEFQHQDFHVVISDWMMPQMSGVELIRRIRTCTSDHYVYAILLTSKSGGDALVTGMSEGADEFLTKPIDVRELRARLQPSERIVDLERRLHERNRELEIRNGELAEFNARAQRDLESAAQIQQGFLPETEQCISGIRFAWKYCPCQELAGDMLNVMQLDHDHIGVYVLDVSGHGAPAALMAMAGCRYLGNHQDSSSVLWERDANTNRFTLLRPADAVSRLNNRFLHQSLGERFATLALGILRLSTGEFQYALAGHPPPVLIPARGEPKLVSGDGLPVGIIDAAFEEHCVRLKSGDRMVLYSDGITECFDPAGELFGSERLLSALHGSSHLPIDECLSHVLSAVQVWAGSESLNDDLSLLGFDFAPHGPC